MDHIGSESSMNSKDFDVEKSLEWMKSQFRGLRQEFRIKYSIDNPKGWSMSTLSIRSIDAVGTIAFQSKIDLQRTFGTLQEMVNDCMTGIQSQAKAIRDKRLSEAGAITKSVDSLLMAMAVPESFSEEEMFHDLDKIDETLTQND